MTNKDVAFLKPEYDFKTIVHSLELASIGSLSDLCYFFAIKPNIECESPPKNLVLDVLCRSDEDPIDVRLAEKVST